MRRPGHLPTTRRIPISTRFQTLHRLPAPTRTAIVHDLNEQLATVVDLYLQMKHAHWNVRGPTFQMRHELFDQLADHLRATMDEVAERVGQLGGYANGTTRMASRQTRLPEYDVSAIDGTEHVLALVRRYAEWTVQLREGIRRATEHDDLATEDLLTATLRTAEKDMWFLESHLQAFGVRDEAGVLADGHTPISSDHGATYVESTDPSVSTATN